MNLKQNLGILATLTAKEGKESELESLLGTGADLVSEESKTVSWFAIKIDAKTFGIFDTFPDESSRQLHLTGKFAQLLFSRASELLVGNPEVRAIDIVAMK